MIDKITKFVASLDVKIRERLKQRLKLLKPNPFDGQDIKKLKGRDSFYRMRMGKIRIVYQIIDGEVVLVDIDYRGNIY